MPPKSLTADFTKPIRDAAVCGARAKGLSYAAAAQAAGCSIGTAYNVAKKHFGNVVAKGGSNKKFAHEVQDSKDRIIIIDDAIATFRIMEELERKAAEIAKKEEEEAAKLIEDAKVLEETGCYAIVLEKIPSALAKKVAETVSIPIIGIGAGPHVDGQVLVTHDMLGITQEFKPRFLRQYADVSKIVSIY